MSHLQFQEDHTDRLRNQAKSRTSEYQHAALSFKHQPINSKQCEELHKELEGHIRPRIDEIRRHYDVQDLKRDYERAYEQFAKMAVKNQNRQNSACQSIKQMHEMADILMEPPEFQNQIFLYSKQKLTIGQENELDAIFQKYQQAYRVGQKVEESQAEETIKSAKRFLLKNDFS